MIRVFFDPGTWHQAQPSRLMGQAPGRSRWPQVLELEGRRSRIGQAEEVPDGVQERVRVLVGRWLGGGRAQGGAGVVEELVLKPLREVGDRGALLGGQVGA